MAYYSRIKINVVFLVVQHHLLVQHCSYILSISVQLKNNVLKINANRASLSSKLPDAVGEGCRISLITVAA
jgi:hypothetical protein